MPGLLARFAAGARARLAPPKIGNNADSWTSHSLHWLCLGLTLGLTLGALHNAAARHYTTAAALGAELPILLVVSALNRHRRPELAARLLAISLPIVATVLMLLGYGTRDVAALMLPASLIVCGLLLDRATLVAQTLLVMASTLLVMAAEARGWVRLPSGPSPWLRQTIDAGAIIGMTAVGVGLVANRLRASYQQLRRDQLALGRSEQRYRSLIDLAADAICVCAADGSIVEANRRASELTGFAPEELIGRPLRALYEREDPEHPPAQGTAPAIEGRPCDTRTLVRKDGSRLPVELSGQRMPDGSYQCIVRDVSERQKAEAERLALESRLRQSQKMEAIGRLAGGVAHDFNNLLTAITGSLTLALRDVPPASRAHRWLSEIDAAAWRAASLTRQLLAFSRKQTVAPRVVDLGAVVNGSQAMLQRLIGEDVSLRTSVREDGCLAHVDQGQLEQALLNLVANARDAMPEGGTLRLAVGSRMVGDDYAQTHPDARAGRYVVITVSDSGQGMSEDVRSRVFEPFFTTKAAGTGLGLAMVYGVVQQAGGFIEVESQPQRGTSFAIHLPAVEPGAEGAHSEAATDPALQGTETIVLVEDEAPVREVTTAQLESLGYRVLPFASGEGALGAAESQGAPPQLLITDMVMPQLGGRELARRLRASRPELKVLFISGYGEEVVASQGAEAPGARFLQKPYTLHSLARKVRESLDG
jgi:two-component system cell cycle sensor histidine kinase/response regulator CckA